MDDFSEFVPNVRFEQIPIKNLVSNQEYQRNLSETHILRAAEHFDLYQINPVKVSRRNGINYVFNGQHTIEIVALVSRSRETPVWCMVYDDLSYKGEADIFANQLKYTKPLLPYEIFMANIEAGNDQQLLIKNLVESYGLELMNNKMPGGICAVSALEYIYETYDYHVLDRTLRLCIGTWDGDSNAFSANIMKGIAHLVATFGDEMRDEIFKEKVGVHPIKELNRTAKERRPGSLGYSETMLIFYNARMKFGLSIKQLYAKTTRKKSPDISDGSSVEETDIDFMEQDSSDDHNPEG